EDALHLLREQLQGINRSRECGNAAALAQWSSRLGTGARAVAGFALTLGTALTDSATGPVMNAGVQLSDVAAALERAAAVGNSDAVATQANRCGELLATLDAYAPAHYVCPMHCE